MRPCDLAKGGPKLIIIKVWEQELRPVAAVRKIPPCPHPAGRFPP